MNNLLSTHNKAGTLVVVPFIPEGQQDIPGLDQLDKGPHESAGYSQDEDIFCQATDSVDILVFDVVIDHDGDEDGVEGLGDD